MKRIAIRKLNRTLLGKEGTKQTYITGRKLLDFFECQFEQLPTNGKDSNSRKTFYKKSEYFSSKEPTPYTLNLIRATNEVRLTGFSELLPSDVTETDTIVLESFINAVGKTVYLFNVVKNDYTVVLSKYSVEDDEDSYNKIRTSNGAIKFSLRYDAAIKRENSYWMWDNNSQDIWDQLIEKPIDAYFSFKGKTEKKTIRIVPAHLSFNKLFKAFSSAKKDIITQKKELFIFEEETADGWRQLPEFELSLLEISYVDSHLIISDRNSNCFACYGGM